MPMPGGQLDAAPPVPPNLSQMAGPPQQGQGSSPGGSQQAVIEKLMMAEKMLRDAAGIMPELAPIVDDITGQMRAKAGKILVSTAQGQPQQPSGLGALVAGGAGIPTQ